MRTTEPPCQRCKGQQRVEVTLRDRSGEQRDGFGVVHIIGCPMCNGKGYVSDQDRKEYYKSWGIESK